MRRAAPGRCQGSACGNPPGYRAAIRPPGRQGRQRDAAAAPRRVVAQVLHDQVEVRQQPPRGHFQHPSLRRQFDMPRGAVEQPHAGVVLDGADQGAKGGLRQMTALRRPREMLFLRRGRRRRADAGPTDSWHFLYQSIFYFYFTYEPGLPIVAVETTHTRHAGYALRPPPPPAPRPALRWSAAPPGFPATAPTAPARSSIPWPRAAAAP